MVYVLENQIQNRKNEKFRIVNVNSENIIFESVIFILETLFWNRKL